jgi:hypothetical protein
VRDDAGQRLGGYFRFVHFRPPLDGLPHWAPPAAADDQQLPPRSARSWAKTQRLFEVLGLMEEKHPVEAHYYLFLFLLGTRPG